LSPTDSRSSFTLARTEGSSSTKNTIDSLGAVSLTACGVSFQNGQRASLSVEIKLGAVSSLTRCVPSASSSGIVASSRCAGNLATRRPIGPTSSPSEWQNLSGNLPCGLPRAFQGLLAICALRRRACTEIPPHTTTRSAAQSLSVQWRCGSPLLSVCSLLPPSCERASFCFSWVRSRAWALLERVAEPGLGHRLTSELTHSVTPTRHVFLRLKIGT
jgi:hypothetical protein